MSGCPHCWTGYEVHDIPEQELMRRLDAAEVRVIRALAEELKVSSVDLANAIKRCQANGMLRLMTHGGDSWLSLGSVSWTWCSVCCEGVLLSGESEEMTEEERSQRRALQEAADGMSFGRSKARQPVLRAVIDAMDVGLEACDPVWVVSEKTGFRRPTVRENIRWLIKDGFLREIVTYDRKTGSPTTHVHLGPGEVLLEAGKVSR